MKTTIWDVRNYVEELSTYPQINEIKAMFDADGLVAIPTETVYGLAANALSEAAVSKVYSAKGRPGDNPLIVHIFERQQMTFVESIHDAAEQLMAAFWPGPISFIFPLKDDVLAPSVTAGHASVAVRMPADPTARQLLEVVQLPLAAPSANLSGRPSPTQFRHVYEDLNGRIDGIVQGPDSEVGLESTVLDCTSYPFKIARPGAITQSMLERIVPGCVTTADYRPEAAPIAPGMKYRHYAPKSPMKLIEGGIQSPITVADDVAVIAPESARALVNGKHFYALCSTATDYDTAASRLYDILREMDHLPEVKEIYMSGFERNENTRALMNRIEKACSGK